MGVPTTLSKASIFQGRFLVLRGENKQIMLVSSKGRAVMIINGCNMSVVKSSNMTVGGVQGSPGELTS